MQSFYSIISISPNPVSNDQVAIGLVVGTGDQLTYRFAEWKIARLRGLLQISPQNLKSLLSQITTRLEAANTGNLLPHTPINSAYFEYLNQYSHGLIRFSTPEQLPVPVSEQDFLSLYQMFVDQGPSRELAVIATPEPRAAFKSRIKSTLVLPLKDRVHTEFKLSGKLLPGIYFDLEVDCIGQNGKIYAAKSLDLNNVGFPTNDKHLNHFNTVINVLNAKFRTGEKNAYFVIADEPSLSDSPAHQQWEAIQKMPWLKLVPSKNAAEVSDLILRSNAKKFLS
jgi:hypothetical protein